MTQRMLGTTDLTRLVAQHADFVWRTLRRLGVPESMVDDGVQHVFLTLQAKLGDVLEGKERAFLFGVAVNVASHARRSVSRRREVDEDEAAGVADGGRSVRRSTRARTRWA